MAERRQVAEFDADADNFVQNFAEGVDLTQEDIITSLDDDEEAVLD